MAKNAVQASPLAWKNCVLSPVGYWACRYCARRVPVHYACCWLKRCILRFKALWLMSTSVLWLFDSNVTLSFLCVLWLNWAKCQSRYENHWVRGFRSAWSWSLWRSFRQDGTSCKSKSVWCDDLPCIQHRHFCIPTVHCAKATYRRQLSTGRQRV